jgi:hypothetical protein
MEPIIYGGLLCGIGAIYGAWVWDIMDEPSETYPMGRSGKFLHLALGFGIVGFIALGLLRAIF